MRIGPIYLFFPKKTLHGTVRLTKYLINDRISVANRLASWRTVEKIASGIKCIASDFDFTLSHFRTPLAVGFFNIFRKRGMSDEDIWKMREEAEARRGFSLNTFIDIARESKGLVFEDKAEIQAEFNVWIESVVLYPDSAPFLKKWFGSIPIAIVTAGDQKYQSKKVALVGIKYNELHVVTPPRKKWQVLDELLSRYGSPLLFLEDKADELDQAWHLFGPENVVTVLVLREDSPHNGMAHNFHHIKIRSLEEVNRLITG